jgi:hypothetical protein
MSKDIVIDECVAKNFCNPMDQNYKDLVRWIDTRGVLAVSQKLIVGYNKATGQSPSASNIVLLIGKLQRVGRLNLKTSRELKEFKFGRAAERRLLSNRKDWWHIKLVLLSDRRLLLSIDEKLCRDVNAYPGYRATAARRPEKLSYV